MRVWFLALLLAAAAGAEDRPSLGAQARQYLVDLIRLDTTNPPGRETRVAQYLKSVMDRESILEVRSVCRSVLVAPHVQEYAIQLVMATQPEQKEAHEMARKYVRYGSSPRGAQALVECGRVRALMRGRFHLALEDVQHVASAVLRHRIILNFDAHADGQTPETILAAIIKGVTAQAVVA